MVRALLVSALISACLTGLLFLFTPDSLTGTFTKFLETLSVYKKETSLATPEPPPGPVSSQLPVGGPLVPVPSPAPSPVPPVPAPSASAAEEAPAAKAVPLLDPALPPPSQPQGTPAAPQSSAPQAAIAPASPSPPKSPVLTSGGAKVIYDQPMAVASTGPAAQIQDLQCGNRNLSRSRWAGSFLQNKLTAEPTLLGLTSIA